MRLDLRSTAPTHLRDVGAAVERLWGALRPSPSRPSAYPAPDARVPATQRVTGTRDLRG